MLNKLVTVITRTKDRKLFIPRVFETVVKQSYRPLEWIIVNDNGECIDEMIESLKLQHTEQLDGIEILLLTKENSTGIEAGSNTGLEHATGVYIKLLDDDDTLDATCIEKQVFYMENEKLPSERGVICYTQNIFEKIADNKIVHIKETPLSLTPKNITIADLAKYNRFTVHSFLYERDILKEIGSYNEALPVLGDWEFNLRFIMKYDIGVIPEFLANYHIREEKEEGVNSNTSLATHKRYEAVIRNSIIRDEEKHPSISGLIAYAATSTDLEGKLNQLLNNQKSMMQSLQMEIQSTLMPDLANAERDDKEIFSKLDDKIKMKDTSADILREIALLFEEKGDIATAMTLMTQALIQRPEGQFIQNKLKEYNQLIEKR